MAKHKKRRPKNRRAGCLLCKPHKANGVKKRGNVGSGGRGSMNGRWCQEMKGWMSEQEGKLEV